MRKEKSGMFRLPKQVRKAFASVLALSMVFGTAAIPTYAESTSESIQVFMGDVNQDGDVTLEDANLVLKAALSIISLTDEQKALADINFDGAVELVDANLTLKTALAIIQPVTPTPGPTEPIETTTPPSETPTTSVPPTDSPIPGTPTPSVPPTDSPSPVTVTPVPEVKVTDVTFDSSEDIVELNGESNNATTAAVYGVSGTVLKLGKAVGDDVDKPVGVKILNPFAGKTEFSQELLPALATTGIKLDAHTYYYNNGTVDDATDDYHRVLDASTRAKAITKYATAVAGYEKTLFINYVTANQLDAQYASSHGVTLAEVTTGLKNGTLTAAAFEITDSSLYLNYTEEDVYKNTTGGYNPEKDALDVYTFPYPTWTNGLTVSTWAKVTPDEDTAAVLYTFANDTGALTIRSDGSVQFTEAISSDYNRNTYKFTYKDGSVLENAGKWVYVTVSIKNDGINVYYNGVKSQGVSDKNYANGKSNQKYFNYGFGYNEADNLSRTANLADQGRYHDILKNFPLSETDYSDFGSYFYNDAYKPLVDFLIDSSTELYIGGDDSYSIWGIGGYTAANEDMLIDDMSFYGYPMDDTDAAGAYAEATAHKDDIQTIGFEDESGIINLNDDVNGASIDEVSGIGAVLTFGDADPEEPIGVEIVNPFAGRDDLHESLTTALIRTGIKLNAHLYYFNNATADDTADDYHRVLDASTKVNAITKYDSAVAGYSRKLLANYASEQGLDVAYANTSGETLTNVRKKIGSGSITSGALGITDTSVYLKYTEEDIYYNTTGGWDPTHDALDVYQFPYPTWENGVSVSMWVKVDKDQKDTEVAPIFSFVNDTGGLTINSDGLVLFSEGTASNYNRNTYKFNYKNGSVLQKAGEWVYLTVSIKNDGIDVYYNGVKSEGVVDSGYKNGSANQKYFDYGFGYNETDNLSRVASLADQGRYNDILKNFALNETDYSDIGKYYYSDTYKSLIDFLTDSSTTLYLGGDDSYSLWKSAGYTQNNAGMQIDDITFNTHPFTEAMAAKAYNSTVKHVSTDLDGGEITSAGADIIE